MLDVTLLTLTLRGVSICQDLQSSGSGAEGLDRGGKETYYKYDG